MRDTKALPNGNWSEGVHDVTGQAGGWVVTSAAPLPNGAVVSHCMVIEDATITGISGGAIPNINALIGRTLATGLTPPLGGVTTLTVSSGVIVAYK